MGKEPIVSVTYENERISIKKQLTLHKMCVTPLLCGPWANLCPFYGLYCKSAVFSLYSIAPTAPIASKLRLGNT